MQAQILKRKVKLIRRSFVADANKGIVTDAGTPLTDLLYDASHPDESTNRKKACPSERDLTNIKRERLCNFDPCNFFHTNARRNRTQHKYTQTLNNCTKKKKGCDTLGETWEKEKGCRV